MTFKDTARTCYLCYIWQAAVNNLPPLLFLTFEQEFGINVSQLGFLVMFNLPEDHIKDAAAIVGGMKSPTITHLMDPGWVSVQTVVEEDRFWEVLEQLEAIGAEGILVTAIEKMTE